MSDPIRDRCRKALRRNALLSGVLEEGYRPSSDSALRDRVREAMGDAARRRGRRFLFGSVSAAAVIVAIAMVFPAPGPEQPAAPPRNAIVTVPETFLIVTTAATAPVFEVVPTPKVSAFEVVRTAQLIGPLDRVRDEDLLASGGVVGIVGHPGGSRRLILVSPAPHRSPE